MKKRGFIFVLATAGIISSLFAIKRGLTAPPKVVPLVAPAEKPYPKAIAAAGIIEALGENISVGAPENGLVQEVYVKVQDVINKGDPLFTLDTRLLKAELLVAEAKLKIAQAELSQLQDQLARLQSIKDTRAISYEEFSSKEHECAIANATLQHLHQETKKITSQLERLTVRSPIQGVVLQKNIQVGQYLVAGDSERPPLIVGDTRQLQLRTDIDEHNASHLDPRMKAVASPKNKPDLFIPLQFVRTEPYIIPKTSLTGSSKEKVDTRVLRVIYTLNPPQDVKLYVGQQMDVYIQRGARE